MNRIADLVQWHELKRSFQNNSGVYQDSFNKTNIIALSNLNKNTSLYNNKEKNLIRIIFIYRHKTNRNVILTTTLLIYVVE